MEGNTQALLLRIADQLARIEQKLATVVSPGEVRQAIGDAAEHIADVADTTDIQGPQLREVLRWIHARMSGADLEAQFETQYIITKQLTSIMQGTRDDIVLLRGDFRRLAALLEQTLRLRVEDDERGIVWKAGDPERRQTSIPDRRREQ